MQDVIEVMPEILVEKMRMHVTAHADTTKAAAESERSTASLKESTEKKIL